MICRFILVLSIGFSSAQASLAAPEPSTAALSLETIYQLAMDQAPSLAIAKYKVDSAEAQRADARGSLLPQLSLFGEWSENTLSYDDHFRQSMVEKTIPASATDFRHAKRCSICRDLERCSAGVRCLTAPRVISLKSR